MSLVNPHLRCWYSDSPFVRIHYFYTAGPEDGLDGLETCPPQLTLIKRHSFVIEKGVEGVKQDEKHIPDLLEPIMRPTCLVKEELRPNLSKIDQFSREITKIRV